MQDENGTARTGPLSWRDVYHAVERSEDRILVRMDEGFDRVMEVLDDHEHRIEINEDWRKARDASEGGRMGVWNQQRVVLVTILAFGGFAVSAINFILNQLFPV